MLLKMEKKTMAKNTFGYFTIVIICFILGFGLTLQIKSVYKNNSDINNTEMARADQLQQMLNDAKQQNTDLVKQVYDYKTSLDNFRSEQAKTGDITKALNDQLTKTEIMAGVTNVEGPGIIVTMNDSNSNVPAGGDPSNYIIHDIDILQVLNELRDAGAEALSLNGERILSTTEVRCAGNTVSVNNRRYSTPFVIKAIGQPDNLKSALLMKNGIVEMLGQWNIEVLVETNNDLVINGYSGTAQYSYAKPTTKKG
jgi:uncharacterized protein YlxW (UPF0749 family)